MDKLQPITTDNRGFTTEFECTNCNRVINIGLPDKDLDFNFCPYCGKEVE